MQTFQIHQSPNLNQQQSVALNGLLSGKPWEEMDDDQSSIYTQIKTFS